ncbi:MAG TPA: nuclear transport factor 2 family protein [Polyangiaceae bacterium]|nr:nuclear transport factor 2 family protein [Polyangiaceae bacterium]
MSLRSLLAAAAFLALGALGAAGASCSRSQPPSTEAVVTAERAFAADGVALGLKASFLKHAATDAIIIRTEPVNARDSLSKMPDPKPGEKSPQLAWWPLWAGVSSSGDLGFTTGPFTLDDKRAGHYFTVWKKQPDNSWKWVFDAGVSADPAAEAAPGSPAGQLPIATVNSGTPDAASAEVRAAEDELAKRAAADLPGAYLAALADDGRVHTEGVPPGKGRDAFAAALAPRPPKAEFAYIGGGAAKAGDLVWTYGSARWGEGAEAKKGHYARVWQKRPEGWRIVFDQILPPRKAPQTLRLVPGYVPPGSPPDYIPPNVREIQQQSRSKGAGPP